MKKCITYIHEGQPRLTWPAVTIDPETGAENSNIDALIAALPPGTDYTLVSPEEAEAWWRDNQPAPTPEEQQAAFTVAIDGYMNGFAFTRGYDSMASAASYAGDEDPIFAVEGDYAKRMRSAVYRAAYAILDDVLSGARPMPTIEEVLAELPQLAWPEA